MRALASKIYTSSAVFSAVALLRFGQRGAAAPPSARPGTDEKSIPNMYMFQKPNSIISPTENRAICFRLNMMPGRLCDVEVAAQRPGKLGGLQGYRTPSVSRRLTEPVRPGGRRAVTRRMTGLCYIFGHVLTNGFRRAIIDI